VGGWVTVQVGVHSVSLVAFAQPAWDDTPSRGRTPAVDDTTRGRRRPWTSAGLPRKPEANLGDPAWRITKTRTGWIQGFQRPVTQQALPGSGKHEWITEVAPVNASGSPLGGHRCDHRTVVAMGSARLGG
jgi:hypothetical protein